MTAVQSEVRRLSVGTALFTLASGILASAGVSMDQKEKADFQAGVLQELTNAKSSLALCFGVGGLIKRVCLVADVDSLAKLPDDEQLVTALGNASTNRKAGNLRDLFTLRISAAVVTIGPLPDEKIHSSIQSVKEQIRDVAATVDQLCSHLELVYAQLYIALLASAQMK